MAGSDEKSENRRPWVKLWGDVLDSRKLAKAGEAADWLFTRLLVICGENGVEDRIENVGAEDLAWRLRKETDEIEQRLCALERVGLIERDGDTVRILGWYGHQSERTDADRARDSRGRRRPGAERPNADRDADRDATVTRPNADRDSPALEPEPEQRQKESQSQREKESQKPFSSASACTPRAREPSDNGPDGPAGRVSGSGQGKKPGPAGERALGMLLDNLAAPEAKIHDLLGEDEALALAVRSCGGWPRLAVQLRDGGTRAQTGFLRAFGQACASLRGPRGRPGGGTLAASGPPDAR